LAGGIRYFFLLHDIALAVIHKISSCVTQEPRVGAVRPLDIQQPLGDVIVNIFIDPLGSAQGIRHQGSFALIIRNVEPDARVVILAGYQGTVLRAVRTPLESASYVHVVTWPASSTFWVRMLAVASYA